jgi:MATE family multidrug resistance protein
MRLQHTPRRDLLPRFFRLSLLNILSNITVPLAGLVDTAMLGHLGDIRFLAGVALATVLFDFVYWSFGFLRMGTTGTTAQAIGRGDTAEAFLVLYRSLLIAVTIALVLLVLQLPLREAGFGLLSGEPAVEQAGRDYFDARIWAAPATLMSFVLVGWFLGREESRYVLWMTVAANVANIALNYVFIIRLGLAARGAGLATMLSQYVMLALGLGLFLRVAERPPWRWRAIAVRERLAELFRLNGDILVRTLGLVTAFALFTNFSSILGTTVLAANTILLRLLSLAAFLIDGAAFAAESLAGIFRGAGDHPSLRRLFRVALWSGEGFALLTLVALFAWPGGVLALLTSHGDVIAETRVYMPWLWPTLVFGALAYMYDGLFLGLTEGRTLRNTMLLSTLLVFVPLAWLAARTGSNHALWAALAAFMVARTVTLGRAGILILRRGRA